MRALWQLHAEWGKQLKGNFFSNNTKENHKIREYVNAPLSPKENYKFTENLDFVMLAEEGAIKVGISYHNISKNKKMSRTRQLLLRA